MSVPAGSVPCMVSADMVSVEVTMSSDGPISFVRGGRMWHVGVQPVRWFERVDWWHTARRLPRLMDVEVWQVQARIGHNPKTPLVTFELVLGQDRATWSVRSMATIAA